MKLQAIIVHTGVEMMKKYIALMILSISIILTVFAVGYTRAESAEMVRGVRLSQTTAVERISCSGTVEYADGTTKTASGSGIVRSVLARNGARVEQGDVIMTVCETSADISSADIFSSLTSNGADALTQLIGSGAKVAVYTAGSSGVLSGLDIEQGSVYLKGQTLFRVSNEGAFRVALSIPEKDISKVAAGQRVSIDCKALPKLIYGTVSSISDSASSSGKVTTVRVNVLVDDAPPELRSGYTADCSITVSKKENVLLAPYSAVAEDDSGSYVFLRGEGCVKKTNVTTGAEFSNGVEILSGVSRGDIAVYDASRVTDEKNTVIDTVTVDRS